MYRILVEDDEQKKLLSVDDIPLLVYNYMYNQ